MGRRTWWFGVVLGTLLVAMGVAETVRLVTTDSGGFAFWFGTLVGGGSLVLAGTLLAERSPTTALWLTVVGCVVGMLPTMWTVVVPVLLMVLLVLRAVRFGTVQPSPDAGSSTS